MLLSDSSFVSNPVPVPQATFCIETSIVLIDPGGSLAFWTSEDCIGCDDRTSGEEYRKHGREGYMRR